MGFFENNIVIRKIDPENDIVRIEYIFDNLNKKDKEFTALCLDKKRYFTLEYIKKGQGYVVLINGTIVGVLVYTTYSESKYTMLDEIVIDKQYRSIGLSKKLINRFHKDFNHTIAITHEENIIMINNLKKNKYEKLLDNSYNRTILWIRI